jgi:hypothetical protein
VTIRQPATKNAPRSVGRHSGCVLFRSRFTITHNSSREEDKEVVEEEEDQGAISGDDVLRTRSRKVIPPLVGHLA